MHHFFGMLKTTGAMIVIPQISVPHGPHSGFPSEVLVRLQSTVLYDAYGSEPQ
jgi:hypothetical protein